MLIQRFILLLVTLLLGCSAVSASRADTIIRETVVVHDTVFLLPVDRMPTERPDFVAPRPKPRRVWPVEGEIYYGAAVSPFTYNGRPTTGGAQLGLEFRGNLRDQPVSVGGGLGFMVLSWENWPGDYDYCLTGGLTLYATIERNFRRGSKFSPFIGGDVGLCIGGSSSNDGLMVPVINAKAGIELVHTLRLTANTMIGPREVFSFGLSLGIVLGGYPSGD